MDPNADSTEAELMQIRRYLFRKKVYCRNRHDPGRQRKHKDKKQEQSPRNK